MTPMHSSINQAQLTWNPVGGKPLRWRRDDQKVRNHIERLEFLDDVVPVFEYDYGTCTLLGRFGNNFAVRLDNGGEYPVYWWFKREPARGQPSDNLAYCHEVGFLVRRFKKGPGYGVGG